MITFKFVIDITKSNSNNIPAVYLFLRKLFRWLEEEASDKICKRKKNYAGIYFSDEQGNLEQKEYRCSPVFEQGEYFLKDFADQKILNGSKNGKEDMVKALEAAVHAGRTVRNGEKSKDIIFLFTDQTLEEEMEFTPAENRELLGVFLFADFQVNTNEKDAMNMVFPIRTVSRTMEAPFQYDWKILQKAAGEIPECILFPLSRIFEL